MLHFYDIHSYWDLIIGPLYFVIFFIFAHNFIIRFEEDPKLRRLIRLSFLLKNIISLAFITFFWIKYGYLMDTGGYYLVTKKIATLINTEEHISFTDIFFRPVNFNSALDTENVWSDSTATFPFLILPFWYMAFSSFFGMMFLLNTFVFIASCYLHKTLKTILPAYKEQSVYAIFMLPTVILWASGMYKDTLAYTSLCMVIYCTFRIFITHTFKLKHWLILLIAAWLISITKSHVMIVFAFLGFWVIGSNTKWFTLGLKIIIYSLSIAILLVVFDYALGSLEKSQLDIARFSDLKKLTGVIKGYNQFFKSDTNLAGSSYDIGTFEPSFKGIVRLLPAGFVVTFYRPFIWETRNPVLMLNLVESMILLLMTLNVLFKLRIKIFTIITGNSFLLFCFLYTFFLGAMIGITSFNFGSLARYKTPVMPFFAFLIFVLYSKAKEIKKKRNPPLKTANE
ncbi:MAG: hypothetical protein KA101_00285 [Saprospiraceae bacterium]|nr:hypothetical protein [Saprospiraceae bacterium]